MLKTFKEEIKTNYLKNWESLQRKDYFNWVSES